MMPSGAGYAAPRDGPRGFSNSERKAKSTNDGYSAALKHGDSYVKTLGNYPNTIDECSAEQICKFEFFQGYARFIVKELGKKGNSNDKYAVSSMLQYFSGVKMYVSNKFATNGFWKKCDDLETEFAEITGYINREATGDLWDQGKSKKKTQNLLGRSQINYMCSGELYDMANGGNFTACAENRLMYTVTWQSAGRPGEGGNSSFTSLAIDHLTDMFNILQKERKLSMEKENSWVPDVSLAMDVYHSQFVYYLAPHSFYDMDIGGDSPNMFPHWYGEKGDSTSKALNNAVKNSAKRDDAARNGLYSINTGQDFRYAALSLLAMSMYLTL